MDKVDWYEAWKAAVANGITFLGYWEWTKAQTLAQEAEAWEKFMDKLETEDEISYVERLAHLGSIHKVPRATKRGK